MFPARPRSLFSIALFTTLLSFVAVSVRAEPAPSAAAVLAAAKEAAGGERWANVRSLHTQARVKASGLSGTGESLDEVTTGHHADSWKLGPVVGGSGFDGQISWQVDPSGQVTKERASEGSTVSASLRGAFVQAYLRSFSYWFPERRAAKVESLGIRTEGTLRFEVVRAEPVGGRVIELWFDAETHLLARTVEGTGSEERTTFLSDYREVQGLKFAFAQRSTTGDARFDTVFEIDSIEIDGPFDRARFAPPAERNDDWAFADGRSEVTVPFELANDHIFLEVEIDGRGTLPFLFDTGGVNVLTPEVAKRLGLESRGSIEGRGVGEKTESVGVTEVESVRIGGLTIHDQVFFVIPFTGLDEVEGRPIAGLVGFEVAKRLPVRIDYAGRKVTFFSPDEFRAPAGAKAIPIAFDERTPRVEGQVDGLTGRFSIDTGSRGSLDLMSPFVEKNALVSKYRTTPEVTTGWGVGGAAKGRVARVASLVLGGVEIPNVVTGFSTQKKGALADPNLAGNVGGGVLKRFTVTLDYRAERMYLEPNSEFGKPETFDRSGMWLRKVDGGFRIDDLVADGPAARASLAAGDVITAIDGKPTTETSLADFRARLKGDAVGTKITLGVLRQGKTKEVEIELREIVP